MCIWDDSGASGLGRKRSRNIARNYSQSRGAKKDSLHAQAVDWRLKPQLRPANPQLESKQLLIRLAIVTRTVGNISYVRLKKYS